MAFTGVTIIRSVRFGGGYTFILKSIAYPSAGSERTYVMGEVLQGELPDNLVSCSNIGISLNSQIQNTLSFIFKTCHLKRPVRRRRRHSRLQNHTVPIECLTFAELRRTLQYLTDHIYCLAHLSTNTGIEDTTRYRQRSGLHVSKHKHDSRACSTRVLCFQRQLARTDIIPLAVGYCMHRLSDET
jgi:hypothetical protein